MTEEVKGKILVLFVMVFALLNSCMVYNSFQDTYNLDALSGKRLYYLDDFESLKSEKEICDYIKSRVSYRKNEAFKACDPAETLSRGYGDCQDFTILFMNIAFFALNKKYNAIAVDGNKRSVINGGFPNHLIAESKNGKQIDPQGCQYTDYTVMYRYTFDEIFSY